MALRVQPNSTQQYSRCLDYSLHFFWLRKGCGWAPWSSLTWWCWRSWPCVSSSCASPRGCPAKNKKQQHNTFATRARNCPPKHTKPNKSGGWIPRYRKWGLQTTCTIPVAPFDQQKTLGRVGRKRLDGPTWVISFPFPRSSRGFRGAFKIWKKIQIAERSAAAPRAGFLAGESF